VLGAGAVGCYFGGMLARAGAPVTLIGRPQHVKALERDGLLWGRSPTCLYFLGADDYAR
jgi:ketopantoate reductase